MLLLEDRDMKGRRLYDEIAALVTASGRLEQMGQKARTFAHPDAAQRAAALLGELTYGRA
jgi:UDP-N-acetylglucosamine:LPS N-acetylglucosamine transferase